MNRNSFRIQPLAKTDISAISRVHYRSCSVAYRFMNWSYSLDEVLEWHEGLFPQWTWTSAAVDQDGAIVGYIALRDRHVDQLFVDPTVQQAGVGSLLLGSAIEKFPGPLTLDVFEDNTSARAFYEKHGFQLQDRWMNEDEGAIDLRYVRG